MKHRKLLSRQVGVMYSPDDYELLEALTQREEVTKSEFIRTLTDGKLNQFKKREEEHWKNMAEDNFKSILNSLVDYLKLKLVKSGDQYLCGHKHGYIIDENAFKYTKTFCKEVNIIFDPFRNRLERYLSKDVNCDCEVVNFYQYNNNETQGGSDDGCDVR